METMLEKALNLIEETRTTYYNDDWTEKPGMRCVDPDGRCRYKPLDGSISPGCALGRLGPGLAWAENLGPHLLTNSNNVDRILDFIPCDYRLDFARAIQKIHDGPKAAKQRHEDAVEYAREILRDINQKRKIET